MQYIEITDFNKTQHYHTGRRPPWIKHYTEDIEEFDAKGRPLAFHSLSDQAKLALLLMRLLASQYEGKIPYKNDDWIRAKTGIRGDLCLPELAASKLVKCNNFSLNSASAPASSGASTHARTNAGTRSFSPSLSLSSGIISGDSLVTEQGKPSTPPPALPATAGKRKKAKVEVAQPELPEGLRTPEFAAMLGQFIEHRKQLNKPMTLLAIERLIKRCVKHGHDLALELLDLSIARGWLDLVPEALNRQVADVQPVPRGKGLFDISADEAWAQISVTGDAQRKLLDEQWGEIPQAMYDELGLYADAH